MAFLNPQKILGLLEIEATYTAADFGSGSGGWVVPLAKMLTRGKVYAVDILEEPLSALKSKLKIEKLSNVETVKANVEKNSRLLSGSCDLVLMTNLLFEVDDKTRAFEEAKRVMKPGAKLLIVDWKKDAPLSPATSVSPDKIREKAEQAGFILEKEIEAGFYHWGLIFKK
jgi:ubiquinone/menaquinone biosynthesis C-methylase UbiE